MVATPLSTGGQGRQTPCPACGLLVTLPPPAGAMAATVSCAACGRVFLAAREAPAVRAGA
jgi:uncharacterized paraquat-inducible protein A